MHCGMEYLCVFILFPTCKAWYNPRLEYPGRIPMCSAGNFHYRFGTVRVTIKKPVERDMFVHTIVDHEWVIFRMYVTNTGEILKDVYFRNLYIVPMIYYSDFLCVSTYSKTYSFRSFCWQPRKKRIEENLQIDWYESRFSLEYRCSREGAGPTCVGRCKNDFRKVCLKRADHNICQPHWRGFERRLMFVRHNNDDCKTAKGELFFENDCNYRTFCDSTNCPEAACYSIDNDTTICDSKVQIRIDSKEILPTGERILKCIISYPSAPFEEHKIKTSQYSEWTWKPTHMATLTTRDKLVMKFFDIPNFWAKCGIPDKKHANYLSQGIQFKGAIPEPQIKFTYGKNTSILSETQIVAYLGSSLECSAPFEGKNENRLEARWFGTNQMSARALSHDIITQLDRERDGNLTSRLTFSENSLQGTYDIFCSIHQYSRRDGVSNSFINYSMEQVYIRVSLRMMKSFRIEPEHITYLSSGAEIKCIFESPLSRAIFSKVRDEEGNINEIPNPYEINENSAKPGTWWVSCTVDINKETRIIIRKYFTIYFSHPTFSSLMIRNGLISCEVPSEVDRMTFSWTLFFGNAGEALQTQTKFISSTDLLESWENQNSTAILVCNVTSYHAKLLLKHNCHSKINKSVITQSVIVFQHFDTGAYVGTILVMLLMFLNLGLFCILTLVSIPHNLSLYLNSIHMFARRRDYKLMQIMKEHEEEPVTF